MTEDGVGRRTMLRALGAALTVGAAGCSSRPPSDQPGGATAEAGGDGSAVDGATPGDGPASVYTRAYRAVVDSVALVQAGESQGSGFVYDDGYVVTNAHVVGDAEEAELRFRGGDWRPGNVVGADAYADLAVIAVEDVPPPATPLPLQSVDPVVGQEVVVVGNPFGLDGTVTTGIISGTNRAIPSPTGFRIPDAVQTDAAVNPGNSGGPIVSLDGEVVAVINSGGGENVAFGISAALTRRVASALIATGEFEHTFVGVTLEPVTPAVAEANGIGDPRGIIVVDTFEDSPARGVLHPSDESTSTSSSTEGDGAASIPVGGDVLLAIDGVELTTTEDLGSYLALETRPGQTVEFRVLRDGSELTVPLELGERPPVDL